MTWEQRRQFFLDGLNKLAAQYGANIVAATQAETLGEATLVKPVLQCVPLDGWRPVADKPESDEDETCKIVDRNLPKSKEGNNGMD